MNEHSLDTPLTTDSLRTDHPAVGTRISPGANEGGVICDVLASLPGTVAGYAVEPVVISDGSEDKTARTAKIGGTTVVEHPADALAELVRPIIEIDSAALNRRNEFISSADNINSMVCKEKHLISLLVTSEWTNVATEFPADSPLTMWYRDRIGQPRQPTRPSDTGSSQSGQFRNRGHPHGRHISSRCFWNRKRFRETNG